MLMRALLAMLALLAGLLILGPREPVDFTITFSPADLGEDLDAYLARQESRIADLVPTHAKEIVWAAAPGVRTPVAVVYLHGFSATKAEIRPVPDRVAANLGANLYFTRFTGHGRNGAAMAQASVNDWINDTAEALAIGRRLGERVVVISTSTGGTILTLLAADPERMEAVAGMVFLSPNFGIQAPGHQLLTMPFARSFVPLIAGAERSWVPHNAAQAENWATRYPTVAVLPMAAAVEQALDMPVEEVPVPAYFIWSPDDQVVSADAVAAMAGRWGGPVTRWTIGAAETGDPSAHVLAGDILSPQTTDRAVAAITEWASGL